MSPAFDELPAGWLETTLSAIGSWRTGGTPSRKNENYFGGSIPWVKSGDLRDGIISTTDETVTEDGIRNSAAKVLPKGSVCVALYGATIGRTGVLGTDAATNQACASCTVDPRVSCNWFLFHYLLSQRSQLIAAGKGGAQPNLTNEIVRNWPLPLPPLPEQLRIVEKINALQARSRKARESMEAIPLLLKQFRQSVLAAAFRGDLTSKWREQHPEVGPAPAVLDRMSSVGKSSQESRATTNQIPGDCGLSVGECDLPKPDTWSRVKLTNIAKLETGHTPSRKHPEYWGGSIPWVCIKDASACHGLVIHKTLSCVTSLGLENSAARLLSAGTVCLTRTANSIGYSLILGKPMATSQDLVGWECSELIVPKYLMYLFIAERDALYRFAKGSTHPTIYFPEVLAFHISLPPVPEQQAIVELIESHLARIDRQSALAEGVIDEISKLDQSILAKAFRGDLVSQKTSDEPATELLKRVRAQQGDFITGKRVRGRRIHSQ